MRILITVIFLFFPVFGLYYAAVGIYQGPNYFAERPITIEQMKSDTVIVTTRRMGIEDKKFEQRWTMFYSYIDAQNHRQHGSKLVSNNELPHNPEYYKQGDTFTLRIAVDKAEGEFGLNKDVEISLAIALIFSIMGFPMLVVIYFQHYPIVKKMKPLIVMTPLLLSVGWIVFSIL